MHAVGRATRRRGKWTSRGSCCGGWPSGRPVPSPAAALADAAQLLETALLGPAADQIDSDGVIVVPHGRLNAVPWGLAAGAARQVRQRQPLGSLLAARPFRHLAPARREVVLVGGPGLDAAEVELASLAERYPEATVLADGMATAERVLTALDDCWLAHVAAHGTFRADNPLFSSLQLDDGPLTVYDLESSAPGTASAGAVKLRVRSRSADWSRRVARPRQQPDADGHGRHRRGGGARERPVNSRPSWIPCTSM